MSRKRGFVTWLSGYVGIGLRELAYLARAGKIPGVTRAENGYNFDWCGDPRASQSGFAIANVYPKGTESGGRNAGRNAGSA